MKISITKLRSDIYNIFDYIIDSGDVVEIERKGVKIVLKCEKKPKNRLENIVRRKKSIIKGDIENIDWLKEWKPGKL